MNPLESPWNAMLAVSLRGSALILCVLAVRWLLRGRLPAQAVHLLWLLVAVRLLMPVAPSSPWSVFNLTQRAQAGAAAADSGWQVKSFVEPAGAASVEKNAVVRAGLEKRAWRAVDVLPWVWAVGVVVQIGFLGWSALTVRRRLGGAAMIEDARFLRLAAGCREQLGLRRRVTFLESADLAGPAVLGLWRPRLVMPPGLIARLSDGELRFVLLHELAHVRRHDLAALWLLTSARVLHWFSPLAWLAAHFARGDAELACDETVLRHARDTAPTAYGEVLLKLVQLAPWRPAAVPMAGIAERAGALKERIARIADYAPGTLRRTVFTALMVLGVGVVFGADEKKAAAPEPAPAADAEVVSTSPTLKKASGQVEIESRFIEVPEALALTLKDPAGQPLFRPAAGAKGGPARGKLSATFTAEQIKPFLAKLEKMKGVDVLSTPRVITASGQRAVIEIIREFRYPTEWEADEEKKGAWVPTIFETKNVGVTLEVEPVLKADSVIDLQLTPQVVEYLGMVDDKTGKEIKAAAVKAPGQEDNFPTKRAMPKADGRKMRPVFSTRKVTSSVSILAGQSVVISDIGETEDTKPFKPKTPGRRLIVIVTARARPVE